MSPFFLIAAAGLIAGTMNALAGAVRAGTILVSVAITLAFFARAYLP
jgi:hypothetical protein